MLLQAQVHENFQDFQLYFDPGFVLRRRAVGGVLRSDILSIIHVRQGVQAIDGRFLDLPILPCQTNPSVPDVKYRYFLLHKQLAILFTWLEEPRRWDWTNLVQMRTLGRRLIWYLSCHSRPWMPNYTVSRIIVMRDSHNCTPAGNVICFPCALLALTT